ncbi:glycoside hydrolase family 3 N-terminal domain-containing protein [Vibrio mytili]|uniref:Beta-D-glucoside glucohydrolase n=1 Tax=Vibrio mytili TaxID=50718 RepID=A0A0C3IE90_9VIBR|nr:glycoside hydrolase family 3 N-terminal domain-containing protein [Vibrio mytili]KIN12647.1 BglX [Vibrio mytili]
MTIYKDSSYSVDARVKDLLSQMTRQEKIAQLGAQWLMLDEQGDHQPRDLELCQSQPKLSMKEKLKHGLGQVTRPLGTHPVSPAQGVKALNALQRFLVEETRLGIPAIAHEECLVGLMASEATLYPSALNYGHTWNPDLIKKVAKDIRLQLKAVGAQHGLAPVLDVSRDVRWGRTEEVLSEDPYHTGVMATAYVKGLQGEDRSVLATLKHFVGHSASEGARNHAPVNLGFKELNDTFLLPFEMAVKLGNAGSVMPAYHDIDGEPCHASHHLLTEVLREQWGFDGLVVADYGGVDLLASHHAIAEDSASAAALAFNAGLDIELPDDACSSKLESAVDKGLLSEEKLDQIVSRILKTKFELGLFERPYTPVPTQPIQSSSSRTLAYQVAAESVVLLKNDGTLPLNRSTKLSVIGATADDPLALLCGYSFPVHLILSALESDNFVCSTLLDEIKQVFTHVDTAQGCKILSHRDASAPVFPGDVNMAISQDRESAVCHDNSKIADALGVAESSDVVLACVGDLAGLFQTGTVGEGSDVDSLKLPGVQQELLDRLLDTGKKVIVLVTGGRPYYLGRAEQEASAILYGWAPGQEGARAIADILCGDINPSGKLTVSIPKSAGAVPYFYNHKLKSAGTPICHHFGSPYNFGHGLSYTSFEYSDISITKHSVSFEEQIEIAATITNSGQRAGDEIIQLYVRDKLCSVVRPIKELKGFKRIHLEPKASQRVVFKLPVDMLNFTDKNNQRVVEGGEFEIMLASSSTDIRYHDVVTVLGEKRVLPRDWRMTCSVEVLESELCI